MKTTSSRYILAAEILAIVLFHVVKIKQEEKQSPETVSIAHKKELPFVKSTGLGKSGVEYMLVNLIK